jgi:hypothetical protein
MKNQTVRFGKLDGPVLSTSMAVRGVVETLEEGASPPTKRHLNGRWARTMSTQ